MNSATAQVHPSTLGQQQVVADTVDTSSPAVPPLQPHRRPRAREVSSRFMSPVVSSSSSSYDLHHHHAPKSPLSKHVVSTPTPPGPEFQSRQQQQQQQQQHRSKSVQRSEPWCHTDENISDTIRSLETPLGLLHSKAVMSVQRKQRAAVKLLKENGGRAEQQQLYSDVSQSRSFINGKCSAWGGSRNVVTPSRPDTPTVTCGDRMISSRFRLGTPNLARPNNLTAVTAAARLLQSSGMSLSAAQPPHPDTNVNGGDASHETASFPLNPSSSSVCDNARYDKDFTQALAKIPTLTASDSCSTTTTTTTTNMCTSSPISVQNNTTRSISELHSSMPEVDVLPTLSTRFLAERSSTVCDVNVIACDSSKFSASPCSRSLNLPLSSCGDHSSLLHNLKASEKPQSVLSKPFANSVKVGGSLCLPPLPCTKLGADSRRGRKVFSQQEEMHSLKLLHNHYLQWRYANAKAQASMHAQRRETERKLYSLGIKISDLSEAVKKKRVELELLKRTNTLSTILDAHMPYLDEWSTLEREYSSSLSGAIHALLNTSLQLPVSGNVQADIREVGEALNSATKITETIGRHIQSFMAKAEEMDALILELAGVIGGERAVIEDCGHLLFNTYTSQVEECSLRGHLIQLHWSNHCQPQEE